MGCAASMQRSNIYDDDQDSMTWRQIPTSAEAKTKYIADQTLREKDICDVKIELRALLDLPLAQYALGHYAGEQANATGRMYSTYFMCWCDIQEFKAIPSESYRWSKALHIYHKYVKSTAVLALQVLSDVQREEYKKQINKARETQDFSLNRSLYNELQYQCFLQILEHIFIPFKDTIKYEELRVQLQKKYNHVKLSHFIYYDIIGEGGFGLVLHCKKKSTGKHYAMKLQTKSGMLRQFKNHPEKLYTERMAFAACQHPFIVNLDYAFRTDALAVLVLDLATGGDLARCIKESPLNSKRIRFYAAEIILALSYLHQMKLVYHDLKPQNVLLREDGHIQLADLGGISDQTEDNDLIFGSHQGSTALPLLVTSIYRPHVKHSVHKDGYSIHSAGSRSYRSTKLRRSIQSNNPSETLSQSPQSPQGNNENDVIVKQSMCVSLDGMQDGQQCDLPLEQNESLRLAATNAESTHKDGFEKPSKDTNSAISSKRRPSIMGTLGYMAPEMVLLFCQRKRNSTTEDDMLPNTNKLKKRHYNHAVDYWSLGVNLYVMYCGHRPFKDDSYREIIDMESTMLGALKENLSFKEYRMLFKEIEFPHHVGRDARDLISRLLDVNPDTRLGAGKHGANDIKQHPFFRGIDWNLLEQRHVEPPYKPNSSFLDHYQDDDAYPDFETLLKENLKHAWLMDVPDEEGQKYFSNWNFTSANTIRVESGLVHAMDQYDRNFKVRQLMGDIDKVSPSRPTSMR